MLPGEVLQYYLAKFFPKFLFGSSKGYRVAIFHSIESTKKFEEIINILRNFCTIVDPRSSIRLIKDNFKGCYLIISFDDGLLSQFTNGLKVLEKYDIKAIFFIPTKILYLKSRDEEKRFAIENIHFGVDKNLKEDRFMKPEMIVELHRLGHVIGSHSVNHIKFKNIDFKTVVYELEESKKHLENLIGSNIDFFAFPKGDSKSVDSRILPLVSKFYNFGFSAIRGSNNENTPPCFLHRDPINLYYPADFIKKILEGKLDWYFSIKNKYFLLSRNACSL